MPNLRELREKKGISQYELARRLGVDHSSISMYESGRRRPNYERLAVLAEIFDLSMAEAHSMFLRRSS